MTKNVKIQYTIMFWLYGFTIQLLGSFQNQQLATEFYYVRHGQTDHNIGLIKQDLDVPLNQIGQQEVEQVKEYIQNNLDIKTICYSPLLRTKQTTDIINTGLNIPAVEISQLEEGTDNFWLELYRIKNTQRHLSKSLQSFINRVTEGLEIALQQPAPVLIVAHGGVYIALCKILNIVSKPLEIANCTLVHFYKDSGGKWNLKHLFAVEGGKMFDVAYKKRYRKPKFVDVAT